MAGRLPGLPCLLLCACLLTAAATPGGGSSSVESSTSSATISSSSSSSSSRSAGSEGAHRASFPLDRRSTRGTASSLVPSGHFGAQRGARRWRPGRAGRRTRADGKWRRGSAAGPWPRPRPRAKAKAKAKGRAKARGIPGGKGTRQGAGSGPGLGRCDTFVGLNYGTGMSSSALPVGEAVRIMREMGTDGVKIWNSDEPTIRALAGSDLEVVISCWPFNLTSTFARDEQAAQQWVDENVVKYLPQVNIVGVSVANEILDVDMKPDAWHVVPGMWALHRALLRRGLGDKVKVFTPMRGGIPTTWIPPSRSKVPLPIRWTLIQLLKFLNATGSPFVITAYPFYPLKDTKPTLNRDMAFFRGFNGYYDDNGLYYQNLFDVMIDSNYQMFENLGFPHVTIEVGETGWPTGGADVAGNGDIQTATEAAEEWNKRLLSRVCSGRGTPKRPGKKIRTWLFEAFDEDKKYTDWNPWESQWGLRYMDGTPKYPFHLKNMRLPIIPASPPPMYCLLKPGTDQGIIFENVAWACGKDKGGIDCSAFDTCSQFEKVSAIYNAYYQQQKQDPQACDWHGSGYITSKAPQPVSQCSFAGRPWALPGNK